MITNSLPNGENEKLAAAQAYAAIGLRVIPVHTVTDGICSCGKRKCDSPGKHPRTPHGHKDASCDADQINAWWNSRPDDNIGIRTGAESGIVILDVDGPIGESSLEQLVVKHGALPETPTVSTGGGGRHIYFRHPLTTVPSRTGIARSIDVRGDGGYVVAPPSRHASGVNYAWLVPPQAVPFADVSEWMLALMTGAPPTNGGTTNPLLASAVTLTVSGGDLATAPGVPQGSRRDELCRLVGIYLARGGTLPDVLTLALKWSARCTPPFPTDETVQVVTSLTQKQLSSSSIVVPRDDDHGDPPLPPPKPWPVLDQNALHGLAGDFVRRIGPETESDPVALLGQFLVSAGSVIGRTAFMRAEADQHFGNINLVLVGNSASGRKGSSAGQVRQMFKPEVDATWATACCKTGLSSGEGLIDAVRDSTTTSQPVKQKGLVTGYQSVVTDPGVVDKRLLVEEPEFSKVLKVAAREGNTLSAVIRCAWDSVPLQTLTRNSPAICTEPHISIVGHITRQELRRTLTSTDAANGFGNRFLWLAVRRARLLPDGGNDVELGDLVQRLSQSVNFAKTAGRLHRDPEAQALWRQHYELLSTSAPGLYGAVTGRGLPQVLRLSLIYALLDCSSTVGPQHLAAALAFWSYCGASAQLIFGTETGDRRADDVAKLITETPGISRSEITKALGNHFSGSALVSVLARLRDDGIAHPITEPTQGRPRERWYPGRERSESGELSPPSSSQSTLISHDSHLSPPFPAAAAASLNVDDGSGPSATSSIPSGSTSTGEVVEL